jgi:hypothetical protein
MPSASRAIIPALLAALWPKCPLCLAGYGGMLGMLGMGTLLNSTSAKLIVLAIVAATRLYGWIGAPRSPSPAPVVMSLAALGFLSVSLLAYRSTFIAMSGVALLVMSVVLELTRTGVADPTAPDSIVPQSCHGPREP